MTCTLYSKLAYSRQHGEGDQGDGQTEDGDGAAHIGDGGERHLMTLAELRSTERNH